MAKPTLRYFASRLCTVVAIVLVWRGIWYALDEFDKFAFGGSHLFTALLGIAAGMALLYLPDRSLKEIEKL